MVMAVTKLAEKAFGDWIKNKKRGFSEACRALLKEASLMLKGSCFLSNL
jgi:hypothetical protein